MADGVERIHERLLVIRCQAGDGPAFGELVTHFDRRLRYFARMLLGRGDELDDVMQEVWLDVYRGLPRLSDPGALTAWLYRIARDRTLRRRRRLRRAQVPLLEADVAAVDGAEPEFTAEDAEGVRMALMELALEHREVLTLRFLEEMSYEAIVEVVGCPLGTVRSRLFQAKRALRRVLESEARR